MKAFFASHMSLQNFASKIFPRLIAQDDKFYHSPNSGVDYYSKMPDYLSDAINSIVK